LRKRYLSKSIFAAAVLIGVRSFPCGDVKRTDTSRQAGVNQLGRKRNSACHHPRKRMIQ
jgi:hypothetical protein